MNKIKEISLKFRILWGLLGPLKKNCIIVFIVLFLSTFVETLGLGMVLPFLELIFKKEDSSLSKIPFVEKLLNYFPEHYQLLVMSLLILSLVFLRDFFIVLRTYVSGLFIAKLRNFWTRCIMESYMFSQFGQLKQVKLGTLINNLIQEPFTISKSIKEVFDSIIKAFLVSGTTLLMLYINWKISVGCIIFGSIVASIQWRITKNYSLGFGKKKLALSQGMNSVAAESLSGIRQVKAFSLEEKMTELLCGKVFDFEKINLRFALVKVLPQTIGEFLITGLLIGGLLYYTYIVKEKIGAVLPVIGLFVIAFQRLFLNLWALLSNRMHILSLIPSIRLIKELINQPYSTENYNKELNITSVEKGITFKNIAFNYDIKNPLFDKLNMEFQMGKITAIAGPSGCGKSTICDLLTGFYTPLSGEIILNNDIHLRELNIGSWRSHIGYISQDTFLFNLSVRENILLGKNDATEEEIKNASLQAGVSEFIDKLPSGYDTVLGDSGISLSGGQKQRIAIARAIIRNPFILVFDEATSALDSENEQSIIGTIKKIACNKIVVFITHRIPLLKISDYIYVLENGKISEQGNYQELISNRGIFYRLEQIAINSEP